MDRIRQALDRAREERLLEVESVPALAVARAPAAEPASREPPARVALSAAADTTAAAARKGEPPARVFDVSTAVLERQRVVAENGATPAARVFSMLRTQVLQRMREHGWRTIGVAAARAGDGKTTIASNLAVAVARSPSETALLVDLDLRRPGVAARFGLAPECGIEDVLDDSRSVAECLYRPRSFQDLVLLPARGSVPAFSEAASGARCQSLIAELRARYPDRIVLFDLPPVLEVDDATAIAPHLDCLLVVVSEYQTNRDELARTLRLLVRTPVVGTVLNRSLERTTTDGYG